MLNFPLATIFVTQLNTENVSFHNTTSLLHIMKFLPQDNSSWLAVHTHAFFILTSSLSGLTLYLCEMIDLGLSSKLTAYSKHV